MEKAYRSGYDFSAVKGAKDISTAPSSKGIFIAAMDQAKVYADETIEDKEANFAITGKDETKIGHSRIEYKALLHSRKRGMRWTEQVRTPVSQTNCRKICDFTT